MKVLDIFRTGSEQEISEVLCALIVNNGWYCFNCPVEKMCYKNHLGFLDLLEMDYDHRAFTKGGEK